MQVVLDIDDGLDRVHDTEVDDRVHGQCHVVFGDRALGRDAHHDCLLGYLSHPVGERDEKLEAWFADLWK
jgi:hypothetical protein